ncbi:hypothetical protein INT47_009352 [Mucor saturninus]|uniref:DUF6729 domain-containing protein n=1 Tax=Mucor saturninus TaxID=64648 RepID=A0A8H7R5J7_9FUNG|nr:hypothetical protein INT47_009352 [Mucor saturninus]
MFGGSSSNQNDGASKKKPGPKAGSKRDPHASRLGPERMMSQPNLSQQSLDRMSVFQTGSRKEEEQPAASLSSSNVDGNLNSPAIEDIQNTEIEIIYEEENDNNLSAVEAEMNNIEGTESDDEEFYDNVTNVGDANADAATEEEFTEEDFEIVDEEIGDSTPEDSFVRKYLAEIQNRLKGGVTPVGYQRKTYWVDVEYEGFDYDTRTSPDIFYRPRVFIWLPDLLNGRGTDGEGKKHLKCPTCKLTNLERKEFAKKTKARRIIDLFDCFYLMSMNKNCKKTFSGYNQSIIKQLNPGHQRAFPAILTHKSGIFKDLSNTTRPLFQHGVGPHRLSKILRIMHTQGFDEPQNIPQNFEQFSDFFDKAKYNGYIPSSNYLSYVYSSLVAEYRHFTDQHTSQLGGIILKLDHSFKIIKHMGKVNGVSTIAGLFTVLNEYGEIRMQLLVLIKSHNCLRPSFQNMMDSYRKNFLEEVIPSLTRDVVHVTPSHRELITRNNPYSSFPIATIPTDVPVTALLTQQEINSACDTIFGKVDGGTSKLHVGFDIEWTPSFAYPVGVRARLKGSPVPVALAQIYDVGRQIGGDLANFSQYGITSIPNQLELGTFCYDKEMVTRRNYSLQKMCGEVLHLNMLKPDNILKSSWETYVLSPGHVEYAAVDAYVSLEIYQSLKDLCTVKQKVYRSTPVGNFVALYASSADKVTPAALGYLRDILPDESNLSKREQLITPKNKSSNGMEIVKVSIPGILLVRYKDNLSLEDFGQPNFTISVNRANLLTASEPKYISSLV